MPDWRLVGRGAGGAVLGVLAAGALFSLHVTDAPGGAWVLAVATMALTGALAGLHLHGVHQAVDTDPGTGLHNRRYLYQRLEEEMSRARRYSRPVSLVIIDIDDFKRYNDHYGHLVGDTVLTTLARTLKSQVRRCDIVARWGGEEFALVLPETNLDQALGTTDRIRALVAEQFVPIQPDHEVGVTISAGVATFPDHALTAIDLIDRADQAMYSAKGMKNRVVAARVPAT